MASLKMIPTAIAFVAGAVVFAESTATRADDFYRGKSIKLIIGSGEAGGVDILGRIVARHLPSHIPGNPTIVVQNNAAPESIAAANYIYNIAEPDGLTIGAGSSGLFSRSLSNPNIRFDLSKFTWIASINSSTGVFWIRTDFPCQTFEAISRCPQALKVGATARGGLGYGLVPELLRDALKLKMDMIYGYRNNDLQLAVERGELHAAGGDLSDFMGSRTRQLLEEGKVKLLLQVGGRRNAELDKLHVPWAMEVIPEEHKKLFIMINPMLDLARSYFAPPNIPADRAKLLQIAFDDLVQDPYFRSEVKRLASIEPHLVPGPEMDAAIKQMLSQPKEVRDRVISLLRGN